MISSPVIQPALRCQEDSVETAEVNKNLIFGRRDVSHVSGPCDPGRLSPAQAFSRSVGVPGSHGPDRESAEGR